MADEPKADGLDGLVKAVEEAKLRERTGEPETPAAPVVEPPAEPAATAPAAPATEPPPPAEKKYWELIGEKTGYTYSTEEDLINEIKSGRDLSKKFTEVEPKLKEYDSLDPLSRDIDRALKSGADLNLYLEARNMEVEKLGAKDALKKAYLIRNQDLIKAGKKDIAERQFEREYKSKYGVIDTPADLSVLSDEQKQDAEQALQDAKDALEIETIKAKRDLAEWKTKNVTVTTPNPKVQEAEFQQYLQQVDQSVNELKVMDIPVGDKAFKFGVEDYKGRVKEALSNPVVFLKSIGLDQDKGIDVQKFQDAVLKIISYKDVAKPLSDWWLEQNNAQTVKAQISQPAPAKPIATGAEPKKDGLDRFADALEARRLAERQAAS